MLSLSNQLTVPQVFFNEQHVGGASDLLEVLARWDGEPPPSPASSTSSGRKNLRKSLSFSKTQKSSAVPTTVKFERDKMTPLEIYRKEIEAQPDPTDKRLALISPEAAEMQQRQQQQQSTGGIPSDICAFGCFVLPDGRAVSVRELMNDLMAVMPCHDKLPYMAKYYVNCFPGNAGVDALLKHYEPHLKSREDAVAFGLALQQYGVLHHVCDEHPFSDTGSLYFRLQPFHEPSVLNSFQKSHRCSLPVAIPNTTTNDTGATTASESSRLDPMILIKKLRNLLQKIQTNYTDSHGMDYIAARNSPEFALFEEAACEVQCVSIKDMDDDNMKTAFGLNLYNVMIYHAFIKVGIAKTGSQRGAFFGGVCYNVGGHVLSLDDVEHGILRANTRHPYALSPPLVEKERRELACKDFDPRIHFALNCGANSCPPVNYYTPEALDEELRIAAMSFCEHKANVLVIEERMELHLSKIFNWYKSDFLKNGNNMSSCLSVPSSSSSKPQLPQIVLNYLRGEKKEALQRMILNERGWNTIKIKYLPYDWGTNASRSADFHSKVLTKTQNSFLAALQRYATNEVVSPPNPGLTRKASNRVSQSLETTSTRLLGKGKAKQAGTNGDDAAAAARQVHPTQQKRQQNNSTPKSPGFIYIPLLVAIIGILSAIRGTMFRQSSSSDDVSVVDLKRQLQDLSLQQNALKSNLDLELQELRAKLAEKDETLLALRDELAQQQQQPDASGDSAATSLEEDAPLN